MTFFKNYVGEDLNSGVEKEKIKQVPLFELRLSFANLLPLYQ